MLGTGLIAAPLLLSLPLAPAQADTITYPIDFSPALVAEGFPGPYGTLTVDRISTTRANITFTGGSSGGFNYFIVAVPGASNLATQLSVNVFGALPTISLAVGFDTATPAPGFGANT